MVDCLTYGGELEAGAEGRWSKTRKSGEGCLLSTKWGALLIKRWGNSAMHLASHPGRSKFYYIPTEINALKSHGVNFHT